MVSASGSLLSEVTQAAATVWRELLLHIGDGQGSNYYMYGWSGMQLYGVGAGYMRRTGSNGE